MIEEVVSIELPVHERMVIKKNRLTPKDYAGEPVPRISIVTGIHGDELDGQYVWCNAGIYTDHDAAFMCDCPNIWRYSIYAFFDKS